MLRETYQSMNYNNLFAKQWKFQVKKLKGKVIFLNRFFQNRSDIFELNLICKNTNKYKKSLTMFITFKSEMVKKISEYNDFV